MYFSHRQPSLSLLNDRAEQEQPTVLTGLPFFAPATFLCAHPVIPDPQIPWLEDVFFALADNVVRHGRTVSEISLTSRETSDGLVLVFEDNGAGIPANLKGKIFTRKNGVKKGMGLFLVREILSITGITIEENGEPGRGARFEMTVPKGAYRFTKSDPGGTLN